MDRRSVARVGIAVGATALLGLVSPSPASAQDRSAPLDATSQAILAKHNGLRGEVGAPPLRWNPQLATDAMKWARTLTETGLRQHSPREGRENQRENLVLGRRGVSSPLQMVDVWGAEQQHFRGGTFPNVCTRDWSQCAHYTQMIWYTTTDVGCGFYSGRQWDALVCRYSPPGNRDGTPMLASGAAPVKTSPAQPSAVEPTQVPLDLDSMDESELIIWLFNLIADGATQEAREILAEMQQQRNRKQAMREAQDELAQELMRLRALTRSRGEGLNYSLAKAHVAWANGLPTLCGALSGQARDECLVMQLKKRTSELRNLPVPK